VTFFVLRFSQKYNIISPCFDCNSTTTARINTFEPLPLSSELRVFYGSFCIAIPLSIQIHHFVTALMISSLLFQVTTQFLLLPTISHTEHLVLSCPPSIMNTFGLWLLLLLVLSRLPEAFRATDCSILGHLDPDSSDTSSMSGMSHPGLFTLSNASQSISDKLMVDENVHTSLHDLFRGCGESYAIYVIRICHYGLLGPLSHSLFGYQVLEIYSLPIAGYFGVSSLSLPHYGYLFRAQSLPYNGNYIMSIHAGNYTQPSNYIIPIQSGNYVQSGNYIMFIQYEYLDSECYAVNNSSQTKINEVKSSIIVKIGKIAIETIKLVKKIFVKNLYAYVRRGIFKLEYVLQSDLISWRCIYNIYISLLCQSGFKM
jgi:hypothetical protein